ncbi:MAG: hypothetical protein J2P13_00465 [Acidobacteria bacterium]|nr:hypothetical protein [Acidobacteriota bacterium]
MATGCGLHPFFAVHNQKISLFACISAMFLLAGFSPAEQPPQPIDKLPDAPVPQLLAQTAQPPAPAQEAPAGNAANITVPAGTRLELLLTHPVDSHSKTRGDEIFAVTTAPVVVGDQVAIPAGTYVQGKVEKLTRNGTRAEMLMQSVSLVFPNGYVARAGGPVNIESEEWTAFNNPTGRSKAAIPLALLLGPALGMGIGAATDKAQDFGPPPPDFPPPPPGFPPVPALPPLPPLKVNMHKGLLIGGGVGTAAGLVVAAIVSAHNHDFYIAEGAPMAIRLPEAIALSEAQVDDANQKAAAQPPPVPVAPTHLPGVVPDPTSNDTTSNGTCYIPGSPGTPGTHIPGMPGVDGSPGTPDIDIPGIPPSPPIPYPCP